MSTSGLTLDEIEDAARLVHEIVPPTPQHRWPLIDEALGTAALLKHENHTSLGAFKIRGGIVYLHRLMEREAPSGLVTATRGNHGQSIASAARRHDVPVTIVVPHGNSREKNVAMRAQGATLLEVGDDFQESLEHATALAAEHGWHQVSNFHPDLLAGSRATRSSCSVRNPTSTSSMCPSDSGPVSARRWPRATPSASPRASSASCRPVRPPTRVRWMRQPVRCRTTQLAAAALPDADPEALEIIRSSVDHLVEVDDDQVAAAMSLLFTATHNVAEGAGAAALAGALHERDALAGQRVGIVVTGGNVDRDVFARTLA